jgi:hypothetical protein
MRIQATRKFNHKSGVYFSSARAFELEISILHSRYMNCTRRLRAIMPMVAFSGLGFLLGESIP